MFYEIRDELHEISAEQIREDLLTVGCVTPDDLVRYGKSWGFDEETIAASQKTSRLFRTGVDVHENYTFAEMRIMNRDGHEDFVSLYIKKNFILIVDILDEDNSTISSFLNAIKKVPHQQDHRGKNRFFLY